MNGELIDRVLFVQHQPDCTPSYLGERAAELGMRSDVVSVADVAGEETDLPSATDYDLLVPLGFGGSVLDAEVPFLDAERALLTEAVRAGVPVFGVCFGAQLLASVLGGEVYQLPGPEIGWLPVHTSDQRLVPSGPWLVWHFDAFECPPGGVELARTEISSQAFVHGPHIGLQFHPEAAPENVAQWSGTYRDSLLELGIDPGEIVETTRRNEHGNRALAYTLFDRVVQHAESAPLSA